jgi:hypothetical protein
MKPIYHIIAEYMAWDEVVIPARNKSKEKIKEMAEWKRALNLLKREAKSLRLQIKTAESQEAKEGLEEKKKKLEGVDEEISELLSRLVANNALAHIVHGILCGQSLASMGAYLRKGQEESLRQKQQVLIGHAWTEEMLIQTAMNPKVVAESVSALKTNEEVYAFFEKQIPEDVKKRRELSPAQDHGATLIVLVNGALGRSKGAAQAGHVVASFAIEQPELFAEWANGRILIYRADYLPAAVSEAEEHGKVSLFIDPDIGGGPTAAAFLSRSGEEFRHKLSLL